MSYNDELKPCLEDLIQKGNHLISVLSVEPLAGIVGSSKLKNKIKQEISFLVKVLQKGLMKKEHIFCSNLHHLEAVVDKIQETPNILALQKTFSFTDEAEEVKKINIDIVTDDGTKWIKVKSRNPKAISQIAVGDSNFGQKSMIDQVIEYLKCAEQNPAMFRPPIVCVHFANGVETALSNVLTKMNIEVSGNILPQTVNQTTSFDDLDENPIFFDDTTECCRTTENHSRGIRKLNLDVSTMIVYVSALTNGGDKFSFHDPLLTQQAECERRQPVKPILDQIFQGKILIACQNAINDFKTIIDTMAGDEEMERAQQLIERIQMVPDTPTERAKALMIGGKIKSRSINIFGTGDFHGAMTVTANSSFTRSAQSQGVDFVTFIHDSRALTEKKQIPNTTSS